MTVLTLVDDTDSWTERGLCMQTDPEAFFPEKGGSTRQAKAICNGDGTPNRPPCPVKDQCLQAALDNDERFGIWGGMSERDRRAITRARRAETRVCALDDCDTAIPATASRRQKFCTTAHAAASASRRHEGTTQLARPHACDHCSRRFSRPVDLARHLKHAHPTTEKEPVMAPPAAVQEQPAEPSYVEQITALMVATEGHPDPAVRQARKAVANALVALRKAHTTATPAPAAAVPAVPAPKPGPRVARYSSGERIAALGTTSRDIRAWATTKGLDVPTRGQLPVALIDAYEAAHTRQDVAS